MRFAAVPLQKTEPRSPAAEFVRKLLGNGKPVGQPSTPAQAEPPQQRSSRVTARTHHHDSHESCPTRGSGRQSSFVGGRPG